MGPRSSNLFSSIACALLVAAAAPRAATAADLPDVLHVDGKRGSDKASGTHRKPLRSLSAAIARIPDPLLESLTIELAPVDYDETGGRDMPDHCLHLMRRMAPGVVVTIRSASDSERARWSWEGSRQLVVATEGAWHLQGIEVGSFTVRQRRGVEVVGPADVTLEDVRFRLRSQSGEAIFARDGGRVSLRGAIELNEHLHETADDETFTGILAVDHGVVEFDRREGATLDIGNGTLSVRYYGQIRLGCESARITCHTTSNNLAINSGGRIDLRATPVVLRATDPRNTPIGLEHDGHLLAEDAHVRIVGENHSAIALQKSSTFTCNDIDLVGTFGHALWASSGSMFTGRFLGDVTRLKASTGAQVLVEKVGGELIGPLEAKSAGVIAVPGRVVRGDE